MKKHIFSTVTELLEWPDAVMQGSAVSMTGALYEDSVENLEALEKLEAPLRELVNICIAGGIEVEALDTIIDLIGLEPITETVVEGGLK